jgi:Protein of unknown function (DUF2510)
VAKKTPARRPGWYQDEAASWQLRWWDGTEWTANVKPVPDFFTTDVRSNGRHPVAPGGRERRPR